MGLVHCLELIFPFCLGRLPSLAPYSVSDLLLRVPKAADADLLDAHSEVPVHIISEGESEQGLEDTDFIQDPVSLPGDWLHWGKPFELAFRDHGESDAVPRKSEGGAATLQTVDAGHAPEECQQLPLDREPILRRENASPEELKQGADEQAGRGRADREQAGREQQAERPKRVRRAALPTTATPSARQKAHMQTRRSAMSS
jgi:hypothetical protein